MDGNLKQKVAHFKISTKQHFYQFQCTDTVSDINKSTASHQLAASKLALIILFIILTSFLLFFGITMINISCHLHSAGSTSGNLPPCSLPSFMHECTKNISSPSLGQKSKRMACAIELFIVSLISFCKRGRYHLYLTGGRWLVCMMHLSAQFFVFGITLMKSLMGCKR